MDVADLIGAAGRTRIKEMTVGHPLAATAAIGRQKHRDLGVRGEGLTGVQSRRRIRLRRGAF